MKKTTKTMWVYDKRYEVARVVDSCFNITNGFFKVNGFYPVPYGKTYKAFNTVILPDIEYTNISRFWDRVGKVRDELVPIPSDLTLNEGLKKLLNGNLNARPNYEETMKRWEKAENEVIREITNVLNLPENKIQRIVIYPTSYGTTSSFSIEGSSQHVFKMYLREDRDIVDIAFSLIVAITRPNVYQHLAGDWEESQIIADWITKFSSVSKVLKKYQPVTKFKGTINHIRSMEHADLQTISKEFCTKCGIPYKDDTFALKDEKILVNDQVLSLSTTSSKILSSLIERKGSYLSFEELSNVLGQSDSTFSLYATSKAIQRVRDNLERNGFSGSYIQTIRGKGYVLKG